MSGVWMQISKIKDYPAWLNKCWQEHKQPKPDEAPTVISLFAGCGGSSLGYSMAGYKELLAVEWDDNAIYTFEKNFADVPIWHGDITKLSVSDVLKTTGIATGELNVLDGSPPCQGFSTNGQRKLDDQRNQLFKEYVRLLEGLKPKAMIMENVSGLVQGNMKWYFVNILKELKRCGYNVKAQLLNAKYFGVPQGRQRIIITGIRQDLNQVPRLPKPLFSPIMASEAIADLPTDDMSPLSENIRENYWKYAAPGEHFGQVNKRRNGKRGYFSFSKQHPARPFRTILKIVGVCHWDIPAYFSIPMIKRASSFPAQFKFFGGWRNQWARMGNSVPPLLMRSIASEIRQIIVN